MKIEYEIKDDYAVEGATYMRVSLEDIKAALKALRGPLDRNESIVMACAQSIVWAMEKDVTS